MIFYGLTDLLFMAVMSAVSPAVATLTVQKSEQKKTGDGIPTEEEKEKLLKLLTKQSGIIRELAISRRIDTAEKVTIEEYYDTKGDGKIGGKFEKASVEASIGGSGERVSRRVYTFEGWRAGDTDTLSESLVSLYPDLFDAITKQTPKDGVPVKETASPSDQA